MDSRNVKAALKKKLNATIPLTDASIGFVIIRCGIPMKKTTPKEWDLWAMVAISAVISFTCEAGAYVFY
jgi:hypothetical protein